MMGTERSPTRFHSDKIVQVLVAGLASESRLLLNSPQCRTQSLPLRGSIQVGNQGLSPALVSKLRQLLNGAPLYRPPYFSSFRFPISTSTLWPGSAWFRSWWSSPSGLHPRGLSYWAGLQVRCFST